MAAPLLRLQPDLAVAAMLVCTVCVGSPQRAVAQAAPGSSGATSSTTYTQSVSRSTSNTATFSRDQTFVISGSNVNLSGSITVAGQNLGGVTQITSTPVDTSQLFPVINVTSTYPNDTSKGLTSSFGAATVSSTASNEQINITSGDSASVQGVVINPNMNATVRDPNSEFKLAVTQSTPGLVQAKREDIGSTTSQVQSSMSVFTAPFIP